MLCSDTESDESTDNFKLETMTPIFLEPSNMKIQSLIASRNT